MKKIKNVRKKNYFSQHMSVCPITRESLINTTIACLYTLIEQSIDESEPDAIETFLQEADMEYKDGREEGSPHDIRVISDFVARDIYEIMRLGSEAYRANKNLLTKK